MPAKKSSANTSAPDPHVAPPGTRCLVYLRHSPGDDQSIDSQEAAVLKEVSQRGWKIIRIYKDEGISGKSTKKREAFERMIWQARQTPRIADILIIWDFGRFGRNMNDSMFYSAEMRLNGWRILSMNDEVPAGPMGMLFEALIHWKNEQYLIDLRQNTLRGLHYMAERGFLPGGRPPKGYIVSQEPLGTRRRDGSERLGMRCCVDAG